MFFFVTLIIDFTKREAKIFSQKILIRKDRLNNPSGNDDIDYMFKHKLKQIFTQISIID
jgi:hypothetical protein